MKHSNVSGGTGIAVGATIVPTCLVDFSGDFNIAACTVRHQSVEYPLYGLSFSDVYIKEFDITNANLF